MNNELQSTLPNNLPNLHIHSTDSHNTLGILGVPHGHAIAIIWSPKLAKSIGKDFQQEHHFPKPKEKPQIKYLFPRI
jgi:hypothetical protein